MDIKLILENQLAIMRMMQMMHPEVAMLERQIQFTEQRVQRWGEDYYDTR